MTNKAFKKLGEKPQPVEVDEVQGSFDEWYVNTADFFNDGNLFMPVMHADSLYTMLVPIEKDMETDDFVSKVLANLMYRMLRLEIPREHAQRVMQTYGGEAILTKTKSRKTLGTLTRTGGDIRHTAEYGDGIITGKRVDLGQLESFANQTPRNLNDGYVWPLEEFYSCIRRFCPELPLRITLALGSCSWRKHSATMSVFQGRISERLYTKAKAACLDAEVLFDRSETEALLKAAHDSHESSSDIPNDVYATLSQMLSYRLGLLMSES
ncbi:DUF6933 domain-containing protein [Anaerohalosphaera lusitana]|uniref:DUF6933 domain-containing protein n=1 Tax=Anaerohalosphaera lusitana TaxID=1936003 RepID=UPI00147530D3|nr:hypothetical protein [Anaerohalosphaera lusitana]